LLPQPAVLLATEKDGSGAEKHEVKKTNRRKYTEKTGD
jgi:hypothetical protein